MRQFLTRVQAFLVQNRLNLCLAVLSVLVSLVFAEIIYRVYLFRTVSASDYDHLDFYAQNRSCWEYDEMLGFHYKPNVSADWITIKDSLPQTTATLVFDRRGNSGPEVDDANADVRIAVVGDSFTVLQHDGVTWPYLMQKVLRERTGRKVAVYNYAKDGYGILQMIDQASALVEEKPDIILIAFMTFDLVRDRFWRMEYSTPHGVEVLTSTTPSLQLDRPGTYVRTTMINPLATRDWAERTRANQDRNDPILRSLLDTYLREKQNHFITRYNPFSLGSSYLWEKIASPRVRPGGIANSEVRYNNFAADDRFMREVTKLKQSGIPTYLVRLPWRPDMASGKYMKNGRADMLLSTLEKITEFPMVELLPPAPLGNHADIMIISRENPHPSLLGLQYYAQMTAHALATDPPIAQMWSPSLRGERPAVPK